MDIVPHCLISEKFASSCKFVPHLLLKYNCSQSAKGGVNLLVCLAVLQLKHAAWKREICHELHELTRKIKFSENSCHSWQRGEIAKVGVAKNEV